MKRARAQDAFGSFHPAIVFAFFVSAIILSVIVSNPFYYVTCTLASGSYYLCVQGRRGVKVILGLVPVFLLVTLLNPLFNTMGDTVLFYWLGGRPYTFEALAYGTCTGCMLVSALLWFFSYNKVMTNEKLSYLFGGLAPALTLVITMALRLVPTYQRKTNDISVSRAGIGRSVSKGSTLIAKVENGLALLSALVSWALEGSIITADSMRSRGYGTGRRSSYARYTMSPRDILVACVMLSMLVVVIVCMGMGAGFAEFFPAFQLEMPDLEAIVGLASYAAFLFAPTFVDGGDALAWRISLSRV